jgi:hypothetical protein
VTALLALPRRLVLLLIIVERLFQASQDSGSRLKHGFELRLIDLADVCSQVIADFVKSLLHLLDMMFGIAVCRGCHGLAPVVARKTCRTQYGFHTAHQTP